ncbi:hypothetical protein N9Y42_06205 [Mariniblastus sp.]|nr:hypothetical protein [Mariniblastus sp.]
MNSKDVVVARASLSQMFLMTLRQRFVTDFGKADSPESEESKGNDLKFGDTT